MTAREKATNTIKSRSTKSLIELFELTETMTDLMIPTVRGWIMDELEERNAAAYDAWIDSDDDSPRKYFM